MNHRPRLDHQTSQGDILHMSEGSLALHGFELNPPSGWELGGLSGHAGNGWLLLARERTPLVRVAWQRRDIRAPSTHRERTLATLGRDVQRRAGCGPLAVRSAPQADLLAGTWDAANGPWYAAVRYASGLTLTAVSLTAHTPVTDLVGTANLHALDQAWPWRLHGLDVMLPPWWRLTGVQHFAGLVRALWQHQTLQQRRPDAVLVVRRLALASRLIGNGTLEQWLRNGLDRRDTVASVHHDDGAVHLALSRPPAAWFWRWRGQRDRRDMWGWIDSAADRLTVQEWRGSGDALPCLRRAVDTPNPADA